MAAVSRGKASAIAAIAVFVVLAGVAGYFLYDSHSSRTEAEEELENEISRFRSFHAAKTFPSKKSIDGVKTNAAVYAQWRRAALELASRGDKSFPEESETVFKQRLQSEVRRMLDLPGGVDGKIAAPTFLFGFDQYLGDGGVLPVRADIPRLASELDTIAHVVDLCAEAGVLEVKSVQRLYRPPRQEDERPRERNKKKRKASASAEEPGFTSLKYSFELSARPAALVKVLNALASCPRFTVVSGLALHESSDMIVDKLNAVAAAETKKSSPRRRGRRGRADDLDAGSESPEASASADRLVVDPELDAPIAVSFTLATFDFGTKSGGEGKEEGR